MSNQEYRKRLELLRTNASKLSVYNKEMDRLILVELKKESEELLKELEN